ncbi:non-reducing polyketide synthase phnA [Physcia stellaris]|nr:non-reducing polyketide synthase phnA [Physcia stellaris]
MDTSNNPSSKVWYDANCHCRRIRLRLRITPLYSSPPSPSPSPAPSDPLAVIKCNCSICIKNGYLNIQPHDPEQDIEWLSGKHDLKRYTFGKGAVEHGFCPECGGSIVLFVDMEKMVGEGGRGRKVSVNARMISGIDIDKLTLRTIDGAGWGEPYEA